MTWQSLPWALDAGLMSGQRSSVPGEPVLRNVSQIPSLEFGRLEGSRDHRQRTQWEEEWE